MISSVSCTRQLRDCTWLCIAVKFNRTLTRSVSTCLHGGSTCDRRRAAHEWRKATRRRLPYMAHEETIPGAVQSPHIVRSWQPIVAILIWPLARREEIRPEKNRGAPRRSSGPESVCRSADRIKTPWIIHRREKSAGFDDRRPLPTCLRSERRVPLRLPFSLDTAHGDADGEFARFAFGNHFEKDTSLVPPRKETGEKKQDNLLFMYSLWLFIAK